MFSCFQISVFSQLCIWVLHWQFVIGLQELQRKGKLLSGRCRVWSFSCEVWKKNGSKGSGKWVYLCSNQHQLVYSVTEINQYKQNIRIHGTDYWWHHSRSSAEWGNWLLGFGLHFLKCLLKYGWIIIFTDWKLELKNTFLVIRSSLLRSKANASVTGGRGCFGCFFVLFLNTASTLPVWIREETELSRTWCCCKTEYAHIFCCVVQKASFLSKTCAQVCACSSLPQQKRWRTQRWEAAALLLLYRRPLFVFKKWCCRHCSFELC